MNQHDRFTARAKTAIEKAQEAPVPQEEEMADEGEDASQDAVVETEESENPPRCDFFA